MIDISCIVSTVPEPEVRRELVSRNRISAETAESSYHLTVNNPVKVDGHWLIGVTYTDRQVQHNVKTPLKMDPSSHRLYVSLPLGMLPDDWYDVYLY